MAARLQIEFQLSKDSSPREICDQLATILSSKSDQIPPAYMCNNEKLVIIVYTKVDKILREYIQSLGSNKTENVAYISMTGDGLEELSGISKGLGVNVIGTYSVGAKKSLTGKTKLTQDGLNGAIDFAKETAAKLFTSIKL